MGRAAAPGGAAAGGQGTWLRRLTQRRRRLGGRKLVDRAAPTAARPPRPFADQSGEGGDEEARDDEGSEQDSDRHCEAHLLRRFFRVEHEAAERGGKREA